MQVRLPVLVNQVTIRNVVYQVRERVVEIPDDYFPELLAMYPGAERVVTDARSESPPPPAHDGRNKATLR